mgnify:CR=1 FL=1
MQALKEMRKKAGMTQEELAKASGISRVTIIALESGKQSVAKSSTIIKLADALNCNPQDILCPES